ncbi:NAD(P)-binding protein [Xylariaceae sp. FL1272]|nr:NAD(P)-binding protein [Xylariaceae sp. FL1272]
MGLYELWQQFFPPAPSFTETDLVATCHSDKVFIITGANSGIGLELVKMLYPTGATIYLAGRNLPKIATAIAQVTSFSPSPSTPAKLKSLHLDLSDLTTVKSAAATFTAHETRLDVLWNNAGNGCPPGTVTQQGIEAHVGANCVAPLLFTQELLPLLRATVLIAEKNSVRVVWSGSTQIEMMSPAGGVDFARIEKPPTVTYVDYAASKAGNWFLALEGARRWGRDGIISVCQNPGACYSNLYANEHWLWVAFLRAVVLHDARYGAYTLLFAGFSLELDESNNGAYIWPWGRVRPIARPDVLQAASEGKAQMFCEWCENTWRKHL